MNRHKEELTKLKVYGKENEHYIIMRNLHNKFIVTIGLYFDEDFYFFNYIDIEDSRKL